LCYSLSVLPLPSPAQDFSAGAGGIFGAQFGGGYSTSASSYVHFPVSGGGGFLFFDASYIEASVGVFFGTMKYDAQAWIFALSGDFGSFTSVNVGALGKYPLELDSFILYPLLGLEYDINIVATNTSGNPIKDKDGNENAMQFSALWVKGGIGGDFDIADSLYLRGQFLYGVRLPNQYETDSVAANSNLKTDLGHGLTVKLALGFRF